MNSVSKSKLNSNSIMLFIILESKNYCSEEEYIDQLYLKRNKRERIYSFFNFHSKKIILNIKQCNEVNTLLNQIEKRFNNIEDDLDEVRNIQIYVFLDNDTEYSSIINEKENLDRITNKINEKILHIKNKSIDFIIPNYGSSFEEFIYYHFDNILKSFGKNRSNSIEKIKKEIWGNEKNKWKDVKGKNIKLLFDKCFSSDKKSKTTIENLQKNLTKYKSKYLILLKGINLKK